ncbi:MAG: Hsp70 family protein [Gemmataceae bacterium]
MAFNLFDYLQKQGVRLVESALYAVVDKPASYVEQDAQYHQTVVQHAWELLPPPIRMTLRRRHEGWVASFMEFRYQLFNLDSGRVALQPNIAIKIAAMLRHFHATEPDDPAAEPAPVEPTSASPAGKEVAVGIDLGTTYSLIAYIDPRGRPICLPNSQGDLLTPSVVLFEENGTVVGKEAVQASLTDPDRVAECVKRDMGARVYRKKINGEYLPPEVISSLVLRSLKGDAERKFGRPITRAVITVPAYFEETRRRATMDAGKLAGLEVLDIINEPTAAAIAYGYQIGFLDKGCVLPGDKPLRVLVFDLGGGTFDVTIVEIQGREFRALATDGDVHLGGKDWDEKLMDVAAERFIHEFREDPRENPYSRQELSVAAELAKRTLTERKKAALHINHLGSRLKVEVTREQFEEATTALVERTRMTSEIVMRQSGLEWEQIDRVILVGGSTRMPMIRRMLRELTGKDPETGVSPDEAVAQGAALYAHLLAPYLEQTDEEANFIITNVNSHSLGVLSKDPVHGRKFNKILIPRNSPLPRTVSKVFKTFRPNQKAVMIQVLEGESDRPDACTTIGTCAIRDLPADLPAGWPVRISYSYEANGRLQVQAKLKGHAASVTAEFERENRLPDDDLDMWTHFVVDELRERD